jgi:hypothetical protein
MAANSTFGKLLSVFAEELNRFDDFVLELIRQSVPGLATIDGLLPAWEADLGLPEKCFPLGTTEAQRQRAAMSKYTTRYTGLSEQFFIDLAATYGVPITITIGGGAGVPFRMGGPTTPNITRVGPTDPADAPDRRLWSTSQLHVWIVNIPSSAEDVELVQCIISKFAPAHTIVQFNIF